MATKRPSRPMIDSVMDNVPPYTGVIAKGGLTNDARPTVNGRGDAGSIIHVLVDGREVGTAIVAANGTWSFALSQSLRDGEYRLTARASNEAGLSIPSTSYGIQVDTTPPSQPKIEAVAEGVQPVLSGRAEAYSTVTVYDGKTMLGTAKTAVDGTWTFQLPAGLSNGKHALTVTAMDPAGNTSVASAGFDVTIGPVAPPKPPAQAVLDEMGRDSGIFNFDRLTKDGAAGRLMSGHVSGTLAAGEKVQVSTDGGRTWQDALMKSDGTWVAIDPNSHAAGWSIQTRVVNDAGSTGEISSTSVVLKTSATAPTGASVQDGMIAVKFTGALVEPGSKLSILIDGKFGMHALTAAEINAGTAKFAVPEGSSSIAVAIVDTAGNISSYRSIEGVIEFEENFEKVATTSLEGAGRMASTKYFDVVQVSSPGSSWRQGIYTGTVVNKDQTWPCSNPPPTQALTITGRVRLDLHDGVTATRLSFNVGDMTRSERLQVYFYDKNGTLIHTPAPIVATGGMRQHVDVDVGKEFTRVEFNQEWVDARQTFSWVDDLKFSRQFVDRGEINPPTDQNLTGDVAFYAGNEATTFTVSSTSFFSQAGSGAHGGAGIDTLKLIGANEVLDLTALNNGITEKITGIEILDITGTGNNTLKLSMKDVLNLGHEDLFIQDGHTQLLVKGDVGDRVVLSGMSGLESGSWSNKGLAAIDGYAYNVYENAALNVELIVQHAITTTLV